MRVKQVYRPSLLSATRLVPLGLLALVTACGPTTTGTPAPEKTAPAPVMTPEPVPQAETPSRPPADPLRLMGTSPGDVQALMGNPTLVRRDDMVQVMLYENDGCVFEIVFYEPTPGAYFEARHLAARSRAGDNVDIKACLASHLPGGHWPDQ